MHSFNHAFSSVDAYGHVRTFYEHMRERLGELEDSEKKNLIWCADIQEDFKECLYVDRHHYSAKFSKIFAQEIVTTSRESGLVVPKALIPDGD